MGLVLLLAGSTAACSSTTPTTPTATPKKQPPAAVENQPPAQAPPSEASTENEAGWTYVKSFMGKENQTTAAFPISGTKWRIIWTIDTKIPEYAVFEILVFPQDGSNMLTERISYSQGVSGNTAYIDEGGRDYYLKIIAANLTGWNVTVEDYAVEGSSEPVQITHINYQGTDYITAMAAGYTIAEWDEYVEIKNFSDSPQNIFDWSLKNITRGEPTYFFPRYKPCSCDNITISKCLKKCYPVRPDTIEPRESIRVYTGAPQWDYGGYGFYYSFGNIWNNETPDTAVLYNAEGREVSRKSYIITEKSTTK
jgi:hypothetical protein